MVKKGTMRLIWFALGVVALVLGVIGAFLPLLPTTPFLLLAAFGFARSSPRVHRWLVSHRYFGPLITNWERYGAISRRAKIMAVGVMAVTPLLSVLLAAPTWALVAQVIVLAGAATFVVTRPEAGNSQPR